MQPGRYRVLLLYLANRHLTLADEATESVELRDGRALAEVPISEAFVMNCSMR